MQVAIQKTPPQSLLIEKKTAVSRHSKLQDRKLDTHFQPCVIALANASQVGLE